MKQIARALVLLVCLSFAAAPSFAAPVSLAESLFKDFGDAVDVVLSWFGWEEKDGSTPPPPPPPPPDGTQGGPFGGCTIDPNGCPKP
jgi:hypothetical protein